MSKEVIIDGVNVAGCEFYDNKYCKLCDMRSALDELIVRRQYCDRTVNNACYYKQLKRLEQENQELGKILDCKNGTIASLAKVRDELKEENAKLKKENEILQTSLEMIKNTEGQAHIKAIELTKKLWKIKEVVKCSKEPMNCGNCPMCEECEELCVNDENLQDIILDIIEGAEDE